MSAAVTAHAAGLVACRDCGRLNRAARRRCLRCGARLGRPEMRSLQTVWAFLVTGMLAYIPANIWPILVTRSFGHEAGRTIFGGVAKLARDGAWFVAAVVFAASVLIPLTKFVAIAWMAETIRHRHARGRLARQRLYRVVELIGRWSMIDVFVVAVMAALVQLGVLAEVAPGPAVAPFAVSVIATMLAAQRLDARLIWLEDGR